MQSSPIAAAPRSSLRKFLPAILQMELTAIRCLQKKNVAIFALTTFQVARLLRYICSFFGIPLIVFLRLRCANYRFLGRCHRSAVHFIHGLGRRSLRRRTLASLWPAFSKASLPLLFLLSICPCSSSYAQNNYYLNTGDPAQLTQYPIKYGSVNLDNGNLFLKFPLWSAAQRSGQPLQVSLVYNSTFWDELPGVGVGGEPDYYPYNNGGLSLVVDAGAPGRLQYSTTPNPCNQSGWNNGGGVRYSNFHFTDGSGTAITFSQLNGLLYYMICSSGQQNEYYGQYSGTTTSDNGTGYYLQVTLSQPPGNVGLTYTLYGPDGTNSGVLPSGVQAYGEDSNGNYLSGSTYDQLGRNLFGGSTCGPPGQPSDPTCPSMLTGGTSTIPNAPGVTPSQTYTEMVQTDTGAVAFVMEYATVPVCTNFPAVSGSGNPIAGQYCGTSGQPALLNLPSSLTILLPGQSSGPTYRFGYDSGSTPGHYGELTSITLPQGGEIGFSYTATGSMLGFAGSSEQINSVTDEDGTTTFQIGATVGNATVTMPARLTPSGATTHDTQVYSASGSGAAICSPCKMMYYSGGTTLLKTISWTSDQSNRVISRSTTLNDTGQTATTTYQYAPNTRLISLLQEGDFSGNIVRTTQTLYQGDTASIKYASQYHMLNRPASVAVYAGASTTGAPLSLTTYTYDEYSSSYCASGTPGLKLITGAAGHDDTRGTSYVARGNPTTKSQLVSPGVSSFSHMCYDTLGHVTQSVDGRGYPTSFSYTDSFSDTECTTSGPTYAYLTSITNALSQLTKTAYNSCDGSVASVQDQNDINANRAGTTYVYDGLQRVTEVTYPDGGETTTNYDGSAVPEVITVTTIATPNPNQITKTTLDGLGRPLTTQLVNDPQGADSIDRTYDSLGRLKSVSNRHRTYSSPTDGTVSYSYDALGRMLLECNQDNVTSGTNTPCVAGASYRQWVYTGPLTDIYDEARHHWQQTVDGLGRLIDVKEPDSTNSPTIETKYTYDALSNLLNVNQLGASGNTPRVRSFTYDSLSRLITASNPETGTVCYGQWSGSNCVNNYDGNGNLLFKTDARGVVTQYTYDALNRVTLKSYPTVPAGIQATSSVGYLYDIQLQGWGWPAQTSPNYPTTGQTNLVGRLSNVSVNTAGANAWTVYGYDAMGRTILKSECLPIDCGNNHHDIHFRYDLVGNLAFYDRGLNVVENNALPNQGFYFGGFTQTYDGAGNLSSVTGDTAGTNHATNILSSTDYFPNGHLYTATKLGIYGDKYSVTNRNWYTGEVVTDPSNRTVWQTTAHRNNTGTVSATTDTGAGNWSFTYDPMNRLKTAAGPTGALSYTIDAFGNKYQQTLTSGTGPSPQGYQPGSNNALTGNGLTYDQSGNVTYDGYNRYIYDVEGRLYQVGNSICYIYDGDGDRVARTNCNVSGAGWGHMTGVLSEYLYDTDHHLLSEVNVASQLMANGNIWAGNQLVAQDAPDANVTTATATQLRITDQVGSLRGLLDLGEHVVQSCTSFPYGDGATCSTPADQFFTGKERDAETTFDYFGARYYNSTLGRFISPDPSGLQYADPSNPQSLNLYSYAQNNPLSNIDPTGLDCVYFNDAGNGVESVDRNSSSGECNNSGGDYVRGTLSSSGSGYFPDSNGGSGTFAFQSTDANGTYTNYVTAPGSQNDGTTCSGNCTLANGFIPNYSGVPEDVALNPFAQALFTEVAHQTAGLPNVCGVGITARFGVPGSRLSAGVDFNSQYGTRAAGGARIATFGGFQGSVSVKGKSVSASVSAPIPGTPFQGVVSTKGSEVSSMGVAIRAPFVNIQDYANIGTFGSCP